MKVRAYRVQSRRGRTCKITGITPGGYHVYALAQDIQLDHRDPDLLKSV